jgi:hypothetical protein
VKSYIYETTHFSNFPLFYFYVLCIVHMLYFAFVEYILYYIIAFMYCVFHVLCIVLCIDKYQLKNLSHCLILVCLIINIAVENIACCLMEQILILRPVVRRPFASRGAHNAYLFQ